MNRCILADETEALFLFDMGRAALLKRHSFSSWHNNSTWIRTVCHLKKFRGWHLSLGEGELSRREVVSLKRVWHSVSFWDRTESKRRFKSGSRHHDRDRHALVFNPLCFFSCCLKKIMAIEQATFNDLFILRILFYIYSSFVYLLMILFPLLSIYTTNQKFWPPPPVFTTFLFTS